MRHRQHQPTTVAILGADTLAEDILAQLLQDAGYTTRLLEAHPTGRINELLDDVDLLLLTSALDDDVREAFLNAMRSTPNTQHIPLLSVSPSLEEALLDELAVSEPWRHQFEQLVRQIEAGLRGATIRDWSSLSPHAVDRREGIARGAVPAARLQPGSIRPGRAGPTEPPGVGGRPLQRPGRHGGGHRTGGEQGPQEA